MSAREVELGLIEALEPIALACPEGRFDWDTSTVISAYKVGVASRCQAAAAGPDNEFVATPFITFKAIAKGASGRVRAEGGVRRALQAHVAAGLRGDNSVEGWISEYLAGCDTAKLVETMHMSATWLHRTAAVLGVEDFDRFVPRGKLVWDFPDRGLRVSGGVDFVEENTNVPVMVVPSLDDARLDELAASALLYLLKIKSASHTARIVVQSTGEVMDRPLLDLAERGVSATVLAAKAINARDTGPGGLHRSASFFTCGGCAWRDSCEVRLESEARRPRIRGGIRLG